MNTPVLSAQQLELESTPSWQALDLTLRAGDICLLQLPAGDGMTALARTLLGLTHARRGSVQLFGQPLARLSERQRLRLRLRAGYLPAVDGYGLLPAWSGLDNLALSWLSHASPAQAASRMRAELQAEAERFGIPERWLTQAVAQRNRSERMALALWRVLRTQPELIVLEACNLHAGQVSALKVDTLLRAALQARPAILALTQDPDYRLPEVISACPVRHGAIRQGQLQWMTPPPQETRYVPTECA